MKITYKKEIKPDEKIDSSEIINILLKNRNIKDIEMFLHPPSPLQMSILDFGFKREMQKTLKLLKEIHEKKEMIVVYTDYDADGITGGAILWETLYLIGFNVMPYVPHRKHEGYGFSIKGIDTIKKQWGPALIISVDHGISASEKISYAKSLGIKIIVTDHHVKPDKLPEDAEAIFHIPELSGAGVAYFFAKEIFQQFAPNIHNSKFIILNFYFKTYYLALATIGIVADLVPLVKTARSVVYHGLKTFPNIKRYGITHILKEAGIENKPITPYEIGFIIAPRINAVGRLEHALDALRLLCTTNNERAQKLAHHAGTKNKERQDMVEISLKEAEQKIRNPESVIYILQSNTWHEGIIGLIASKLTEKYFRPTIIFTKVDGFYKGSARSIPSLHITNFLQKLNKYLIDVGGHAQAAGFTIEEKKLNDFIEAAGKKADKMISKKDLERIIEADLKIPISKVTKQLAKQIETLAPFGIGNPNPLFYSEVELVDAKLFGKQNNHLKLFVKNPGIKSYPLECIAFNASDKFLTLSRGQTIKITYYAELNQWGGRETLRARLKYFI